MLDQRLTDYTFHFNAVSRDAMIVGLSTGAYTLAADHFISPKSGRKNTTTPASRQGISDLRLIVRNDENDIHNLGDLASGKKKLVPIHTSDARYTVIENYNKKNIQANKLTCSPTASGPPPISLKR